MASVVIRSNEVIIGKGILIILSLWYNSLALLSRSGFWTLWLSFFDDLESAKLKKNLFTAKWEKEVARIRKLQ